jgi:hypothetical protein
MGPRIPPTAPPASPYAIARKTKPQMAPTQKTRNVLARIFGKPKQKALERPTEPLKAARQPSTKSRVAFASLPTPPELTHHAISPWSPPSDTSAMGSRDTDSVESSLPTNETDIPPHIDTNHQGNIVGRMQVGPIDEVSHPSFMNLLACVAATETEELDFSIIESFVRCAVAYGQSSLLSLVGEDAQRVLNTLQ